MNPQEDPHLSDRTIMGCCKETRVAQLEVITVKNSRSLFPDIA